jgi:hypothetical protein
MQTMQKVEVEMEEVHHQPLFVWKRGNENFVEGLLPTTLYFVCATSLL